MNLLLLSLTPVCIILIYIYYRDKYEKEPFHLLFEGLVAGGVMVFPILYFEQLIQNLGSAFTGLGLAFWSAFMVAALVEEFFKFLAVYFLLWKNPNFNEEFDGIVYAVFVSLGFAMIENIFYVFTNESGYQVGLMRAFTAVPAHAMFGVMMGYRLGLAKFVPSKRGRFLLASFFVPFVFHGLYDFILMSHRPFLLFFFLPLVMYLLWRCLKRMSEIVKKSSFNPENLSK